MSNLDKKRKKEHQLSDNMLEAKEKFNRHLVHENALSTSNIKAEHFDMDKAKQRSRDGMVALDADGGLQSMLAA